MQECVYTYCVLSSAIKFYYSLRKLIYGIIFISISVQCIKSILPTSKEMTKFAAMREYLVFESMLMCLSSAKS
jgi:hypothetical protein